MGIAAQVAQLVWSIRQRQALRDVTGDPWNGRSLEWSTPSPAPMFNFAVLPRVDGEDAYWTIKQAALREQALPPEPPQYADIHMPRNSPVGFICAFFATIVGFALIWHIWWLVGVGALCAYATFVVFAWRDVHDVAIPAQTVADVDRANAWSRHAAQGPLQPSA
jgi:cytochrome o ubiquinol oxidase subunit 1